MTTSAPQPDPTTRETICPCCNRSVTESTFSEHAKFVNGILTYHCSPTDPTTREVPESARRAANGIAGTMVGQWGTKRIEHWAEVIADAVCLRELEAVSDAVSECHRAGTTGGFYDKWSAVRSALAALEKARGGK